jgi:hypothetical protein
VWRVIQGKNEHDDWCRVSLVHRDVDASKIEKIEIENSIAIVSR